MSPLPLARTTPRKGDTHGNERKKRHRRRRLKEDCFHEKAEEIMAKSGASKKDVKKKPLRTAKEKKQAKLEKKHNSNKEVVI